MEETDTEDRSSRSRLKRPSTSEPASPVPSKRSQDAAGVLRKKDPAKDSSPTKDDVKKREESEFDKEGTIRSEPNQNTEGRNRRRESAKYEEAKEVIIPIKMPSKDKENDAAAVNVAPRERKEHTIKIQRESEKLENSKDNQCQTPKKRKSMTYVNGCAPKVGVEIATEKDKKSKKEINNNVSSEKDETEIKRESPKSFYFFGDQHISDNGQEKGSYTPLTKATLSEHEKFLQNGHPTKLEAKNKKNLTSKNNSDGPSSESGMSTTSGPSSHHSEFSATSGVPSTSSDYSTPKKNLTPPDSPPTVQEIPLNRSPKRKISLPLLTKYENDIKNIESSSKKDFLKSPVKLAAEAIPINRNDRHATDPSIDLKCKTGHYSPSSPPLGTEIKVERKQSLMEDDMFKDCWKDYSNTLQDVLSRLQELSSELGQTPKFLVSSPTAPEKSFPGSTDDTPTAGKTFANGIVPCAEVSIFYN